MEDTVNILYQSSDAYAPIMGVSITSLLENNRHIGALDVYIIDGGISGENRDKITLLGERYHRNIVFISGESIDRLLEARGIGKWRNSYAMYYKLYAIDLIEKDIRRLLAIDADTIINRAIDPLYYADLEGNVIGMVQDIMPLSYMLKIGMNKNETYYNSGMVLFDVTEWKRQKCTDAISKFLEGDLSNILYADQDALSIALQGRIKKLPIVYNYFAQFHSLYECLSFDLDAIYRLYDLDDLYDYYSKEEVAAAEKNATIYHYEGGTVVGRPWEKGREYTLYALWNQYKALSPWKDMEKREPHEAKFHRIERFLNRILPMPVFLVFYRFAYKLYWGMVLKIRPNN